MQNDSTAFCMNPSCSASRAQAAQGCSQWLREPGADDKDPQSWRPRPIRLANPDAQRCAALRLRLERINTLGERAYNQIKHELCWGIYVHVVDQSGLLGITAGSAKPETLAAAMAIVERIGVNAAIRAGRL